MPIKQFIERMIGSHTEFSMENRTYNAINLITLCFLSIFFIVNFLLELYLLMGIVTVAVVGQVFFYYQSRFKHNFQLSIVINGIISYIALIVTFMYNDGINGPSIFLFFLTFQLLIAVTDKIQHIAWIVLHTSIVATLLFIEYRYPELIVRPYPGKRERLLDMFATYTTTVVMIYFITIYLRNHFDYERNLARQRAEAILQEKQKVQTSETKLRAFFNSSYTCHVLLGRGMEVLDFNKAALDFLREIYKKDIVTGDIMTDFISASYLKRFIESFHTALGGKVVKEELLIHYNENPIWWQVSFEPAWDTWGNILGIAFNATNINERKEQEKGISDRNKALEQIAFMQSHDFRRPVASIMGIMNLIKEQDYKVSKEYLLLLEEGVKELDEKIHEVVKKTDELL